MKLFIEAFKKHKLLIGICVVAFIILVFGIPFGIYTYYRFGSNHLLWGASDVLLFYGSIVGGFATLAAVTWSILDSDHKIEVSRQQLEREYKLNEIEKKLEYVKEKLTPILNILDPLNRLLIHDFRYENKDGFITSIDHYINNIQQIKTLNVHFDEIQKKVLKEDLEYINKYALNLLGNLCVIRYGCMDSIQTGEFKMLNEYILSIVNDLPKIKEKIENIYKYRVIEAPFDFVPKAIFNPDTTSEDDDEAKIIYTIVTESRREIMAQYYSEYSNLIMVVNKAIDKLEKYYKQNENL